MRAPDDKEGKDAKTAGLPPFDCYSDEQWQDIMNIVAKLDLDADTMRVGNSRTLLCEALEGLANSYGLDFYIDRWQLKPRRAVKEFGDTIAEIKRVLRRLNILGRVATYAPKQALAATKALQNFVTASELHQRLDAARKAGSGSRRNASKPLRRAYLIELAKIWQELVSSQPPHRRLKPQRKLKAAFLQACAAPTFAANATVIKNFLDTQHQ
jgi:hypothetical protein